MFSQKYIKEALKFIADNGYNADKKNFLRQTAKFLADLFEVDYVLINKFTKEKPTVTESVVIYSNGKFLKNLTYNLAYTPCENVINNEVCVYPYDVKKTFPKDDLLMQMNVDSYVGIPLWSAEKEPLGLIALMGKNPLHHTEGIETVLEIMAIKVEKVLENILYENKLKVKIKELKDAKVSAEENEEKLKEAQRIARLGYWEYNILQKQLFWSDEVYRILDLKPQQVKASENLYMSLVHPEDRDMVDKAYLQALKDKKSYKIEHRLLMPSGKVKYVVENISIECNKKNKPIYSFGTLLDVTVQKKLENSLVKAKENAEKNEEKFKKLANLSFEGILISDKGITKECNENFLKMFGYKRSEIIGKDIIKLLFDKKYHKQITKNRLSKYTKPYEIEGIRKDGTVFSVEIEAKNIDLENTEFKRLVAFRDISERKRTEIENKKRLTAIEQSSNSIMITDIEGNIEYTNPAFTKITGYTAKDAIGKNPRILSSGKQSKAFYSEMWKTITSGKNWQGEFENIAKNGNHFIERVNISPIKNECGEIVNFLAVKEDITKQKIADKKLKKAFEKIKSNEARLTNILKTANEGFWIIDQNANTIEVNHKLCEILGFSEEEMKGKSIFNFVDNQNKAIFKEQMYLRNQEISSSYEIELRTKTNKNLPCLFKGSPVYDAQNKKIGSLALVTDISEIKNNEAELLSTNKVLNQLSLELSEKNRLLLDSQERYKNLFDQSPIALWEQDFSEALQLLIQKKQEVDDLETFLNKNIDFLKLCVSKIKILNVNQTTFNMLGVKNKEELITHIRNTNTKKSYTVLAKELVNLVNNINEFKDETEFINTKGEFINVIAKSTLIDDKATVLASIIDISELKNMQSELINAKEKAEESNRLKTEFLNNMSHEIRTPMNGILGFSGLLRNPDLSEEKKENFLNIIQSSGEQLLRIIDDILEISILETKQVKVFEKEVCLNELFFELVSIFEFKAKEKSLSLKLKNGLSDQESNILTDASKLNKVISNLLENALKFTEKGTIELGYHLIKNSVPQLLQIYVKDTGIGVKPENREIIFKRFEQAEKDLSKNVGGLGLGLSIVKENVELLGGKIELKSEFGKGSEFLINLPYKTSTKIDKPNPKKKMIHNILILEKPIILVVEDEEVNFMLIEILLNEKINLNCEILHAKNGKEAVEICEQQKNINAILMDLNMPVMDGYEATKQIKAMLPNIPIIAQTAYTTKKDQEKAFSAGCNEFISKPLDKEKLDFTLRKYLTA